MWLQLIIQIIVANGSLWAQALIHMNQKKIEIIAWKKIKENKKNRGKEIPTVSSQMSASAHILTEHTGGGWG